MLSRSSGRTPAAAIRDWHGGWLDQCRTLVRSESRRKTPVLGVASSSCVSSQPRGRAPNLDVMPRGSERPQPGSLGALEGALALLPRAISRSGRYRVICEQRKYSTLLWGAPPLSGLPVAALAGSQAWLRQANQAAGDRLAVGCHVLPETVASCLKLPSADPSPVFETLDNGS